MPQPPIARRPTRPRARPAHPCPRCNKTFTKRSNMVIHERLHTGEKPYTCVFPGCGKAYKWLSSINFHQARCARNPSPTSPPPPPRRNDRRSPSPPPPPGGPPPPTPPPAHIVNADASTATTSSAPPPPPSTRTCASDCCVPPPQPPPPSTTTAYHRYARRLPSPTTASSPSPPPRQTTYALEFHHPTSPSSISSAATFDPSIYIPLPPPDVAPPSFYPHPHHHQQQQQQQQQQQYLPLVAPAFDNPSPDAPFSPVTPPHHPVVKNELALEDSFSLSGADLFPADDDVGGDVFGAVQNDALYSELLF